MPLPRKLGLADSIAIVVGTMIGGGIFLVPNLVARSLGSVPLILAVWTFAGVVSFFGALACAELGAAWPSTGGQYVYLRDAFGPLAAFLCGWSMFTVARSAQIAWLAVTFSIYAAYFTPIGPLVSKLLAVALLAVFSWLNCRGVSAGAAAQKLFTAAKVAGLLLIAGSAFLAGRGASASAATAPAASTGAFGVALVACLLCYDGWVTLSFVAGEIRQPERNVLRALVIGTGVCMAIYLLANIAYLRALGVSGMATSERVGAAAAEAALGPAGGKIVSAIILVSILGAINGSALANPRIYFAQAGDRLFFSRFAEVHPRFQTPAFAILAQGIWAAMLVATGSYEWLIDYALFATWLFYGLMVAAVIVLRRARPETPRPYRMWGYPATAMIFLAITAWFLGNMLVTRPGPSLASLVLTATGLPAYFIWRKRPRAAHAVSSRP